MADTAGLSPVAARRAGSSPVAGTINMFGGTYGII